MTQNYGYLTDFIFLKQNGIIEEKEGYTLVKSPQNPTFYFGNFLLLNEAPSSKDKTRLEAIFDVHFNDLTALHHYTFCWEKAAPKDYQAFLDAGYELDVCVVLIAHKSELIAPTKINTNITIKEFNSTEDWQQWIEQEVANREKSISEVGFRKYINRKKAAYLQLVEQGKGNFYGAFLKDEMVGSAGLFHENGLGRFQQVTTKTEHRRKGVCTTLLHAMCEQAFTHLNHLVIVADKDYHALQLYQNLGFKAKEEQLSLCFYRRDKGDNK